MSLAGIYLILFVNTILLLAILRHLLAKTSHTEEVGQEIEKPIKKKAWSKQKYAKPKVNDDEHAWKIEHNIASN